MSDRRRVLVADFLDEHEIEAPILSDLADIELARASGEEQLRDRLPHADALILYHDVPMLTDASFARAGKCRGVVRAGVGYNNVDLDAAGRRGIVVCNVPDYGTEEVADHAIMMLLAMARGLKESDESLRRGEWEYRAAGPAPRLRGKVLGIVGCGRIGTATALRAKAFGLDVVFYDPLLPDGVDKALGVRRATRLEDLLAESRFLSLHCYLSPATRHIVDAAALAKLPRGAYVINTARGPVVDQVALLDALDSGHIAGAGLDVFEREPLDEPRLRAHPKVLLTPHSAFYSAEGFVELRRKTALETRRILLGEPPRNPVNRDRVARPRTPLA